MSAQTTCECGMPHATMLGPNTEHADECPAAIAGSLPALAPEDEPLVEFTVYGKPEPRGSKSAFVIYKDRIKKIPARRPGGEIIVNMTDSNPRSKTWMTTVRSYAQTAMDATGEPGAIAGVALEVEAVFFVERPKGHYGTGRNARLVKDSSPARPTVIPDLDKMARGTLDALTGIVWRDDQQVIHLDLDKRYAVPRGANDSGEGVHIIVRVAREQSAVDLPLDVRTRWLPDDAPELAEPSGDSLFDGRI